MGDLKFRDVYLEKQKTISDSGVTIIDLDLVDPITSIMLLVEATNGATSCQNVRVHEDIDKIELVDGGHVIYSTSMLQAMALNFYQLGRLPFFIWDEGAAAKQYDSCQLLFGRRIGDKSPLLLPNKFRNLQLKITHSLTISGTAGFATGTGKITALAKVLETPLESQPWGYVKTKELYSWTTGASGDEVVEFPMDHPHLGFLFRVFETLIGMEESITNIKLSLDEDKFIPLDISMLDFVAHNKALYGEACIEQKLLQTDADTFESRIGYPSAYFANAVNDLDVAGIDAEDDGNLTLQLLSLTAVPAIAKSAADTAVIVQTRGAMPFNAGMYYWDPRFRPPFAMSHRKFKSMKGKFTQGNAGGAASIVTLQIAPY